MADGLNPFTLDASNVDTAQRLDFIRDCLRVPRDMGRKCED